MRTLRLVMSRTETGDLPPESGECRLFRGSFVGFGSVSLETGVLSISFGELSFIHCRWQGISR